MVVALWSGMRVERFSIGFGPVVARLKRKGVTYQIAAIPLGGFVQIAGMNPHEQLAEDDQGSFENKSLFRRMATIFAGPGTNYLFAFVLCILMFSVFGVPAERPVINTVIGTVAPGTPAEKVGLQVGDQIVAIEGKATEFAQDVQEAVKASGGKEITLSLKRGDRVIDVPIVPKGVDDGYRIGVVFGGSDWEPASMGQVLANAAVFPVRISQVMLSNLWRMIRGKVSTDNLGGPVAIVQQLKGSFDKGLRTALEGLVILNVIVGLLNLLPLPALDGGRLAFLGYSVVTRRRVSMRVEAAVHTIGFLLLFGLLIVITFRDIGRIFGG
jgi:regulator of sigma E protease